MTRKHKTHPKHIAAALALVLVGSVIAIGLALRPSAHAATTQITGGTNGPDCGSGGYFTPSSVTINSGDTVTISVPADDPYAGGLQVHGFPEGNFTILPGGSHTTTALTANVSYYGTWPSSGCMKGSGTITVNTPPPPPPPKPKPKPSPPPKKPALPVPVTPHTTAPPASTSPTSTPHKTPAKVTSPNTTTAHPTTVATATPTTGASAPKPASANANSFSLTAKTLSAAGGGVAIVVLAGLFWRLGWLRKWTRKM